MRVGRVTPLLVATACGRIGFDGQLDAGALAAATCGTAPTCPSFALLCDSFEGAAIDSTLWTVGPSNGALTLDPARACRGGSSLHVHTDAIASGTASANLHTASFPFARTTLFMRVYMYLPSASAPETSSQTYEFLQADQNTGSSYGVEIGASDGNIAVTNFEPTEVAMHSTTPFPLDRWICVEWEVDFPSADGAGDGMVSEWLDGMSLADISPFGSLIMPPSTQPIDQLDVGMGVYGSPIALPSADIWVDDIAAGNQRIGCGD